MGLSLVRDDGCVRGLSYRIESDQGIDASRLLFALDRAGHAGRTGPGELRTYVVEGHEVLIVPSSGRVQIRLCYTTPDRERRWAAEAVCAKLVRCVIAADQ